MTKAASVNWPEAAAELAVTIPPARLHPAVRAWAARRSARETWGVAFSGGADSLALLLLLWAHWPGRRARLVALHFNHRLRGREALADAVFCRRVCAGLGVKLVAGAWRDAHRGASEAEARAARMAFLGRHGRVLWLGHQRDDIAESMLMRLARGSGAGGLAAPRPVQALPRPRWHVRPLLGLTKAEIIAALRSVGAPWREDSSNGRADYFRNRVRQEVVPRWVEAAQRDALGGAARSRDLLEEDEAALEAWVNELSPLTRHRTLDLRRLAGKPRAVVRRALHRWLLAQPKAGTLVRQGFEALLEAVVAGEPTRQSLGREGFAVIRGGVLRFEQAGKPRRRFQRQAN